MKKLYKNIKNYIKKYNIIYNNITGGVVVGVHSRRMYSTGLYIY